MFSSNNANQKGYKEWMELNWSCNCRLEGEEPTGEECVRASPTWLLPSPKRVQDPAVLHARVGSPHTPPPSSTFPSSWNCFRLTSGTFFPNQQHFLSLSRAFSWLGNSYGWDQPERSQRGFGSPSLLSLFSTMWRSVSEMCVMPRLTALEKSEIPYKEYSKLEVFLGTFIYLWDSQSYYSTRAQGHSDGV